MKNGELLSRASVDFDVFVTTDRNLAFQQNIKRFELAVVVLAAISNRIDDLRSLVPELLTILPSLKPGTIRRSASNTTLNLAARERVGHRIIEWCFRLALPDARPAA